MQVILLVNLGSPNSLSTGSIRSFLRRFLSDKRVVALPKVFWYPILYGIILPLRAKKLLKQYRDIWHIDSSPLVHYTVSQGELLQSKFPDEVVIKYAFSYVNPDIDNVLAKLHAKYKIEHLTVLPLYPQFSSTTTLAVFDQVSSFYSDKKYLPEIRFINDFHANTYYVDAISESIAAQFVKASKTHLVFSYHSLPERIINAGDIYYEQCLTSAKLIAARLDLAEHEYSITFQSRFGGGRWLGPATAKTMADLPKSGIVQITVVCPGFISDCLETLEEIAVTNRNIFMNNGGQSYDYIPCLNDSRQCIELLYQLVKD